MASTEILRAETKNEVLRVQMKTAKQLRGFAVTMGGHGTKTHAALTVIRGHDDYDHPRPLCQPHTQAFYHFMLQDQSEPVTCKRCLAALAERGLRKGN